MWLARPNIVVTRAFRGKNLLLNEQALISWYSFHKGGLLGLYDYLEIFEGYVRGLDKRAIVLCDCSAKLPEWPTTRGAIGGVES